MISIADWNSLSCIYALIASLSGILIKVLCVVNRDKSYYYFYNISGISNKKELVEVIGSSSFPYLPTFLNFTIGGGHEDKVVKVAGSNSPSADLIPHLTVLWWPRPPSWKSMSLVISSIKKAKCKGYFCGFCLFSDFCVYYTKCLINILSKCSVDAVPRMSLLKRLIYAHSSEYALILLPVHALEYGSLFQANN